MTLSQSDVYSWRPVRHCEWLMFDARLSPAPKYVVDWFDVSLAATSRATFHREAEGYVINRGRAYG